MRKLLPIFSGFAGLLICGLVLFAVVPAAAQPSSQLSADVKWLCASAKSSTKSAVCSFQVPADTIGASLDITVPKEKLTQIKLEQGKNLSPSSTFFNLKATDSGGSILLNIDFADLKAKAFASQPYMLFQAELFFITLDKASLPIVIITQLKKDSELHTPNSLQQNQPAFKAATDIPLEIRITALDEVIPAGGGAAPPPPRSTFTFEGEGQLRGAAKLYCFDDPISSMTDEEWAIICEAKRRGIVSGNPQPNGTFLFFPNQAINRAEAVKIVTLGILRSLGFLRDDNFSNEEAAIRAAFPRKKTIVYPDIEYESGGEPPWFAVFVSIATKQKIAEGYPEDGTFRAANKINNAESFRVIVNTGGIASDQIAKVLEVQTRKTRDLEWFMKYAKTLEQFGVPYSEDYAKFTTRKVFLIMVMNLLQAVGL